MTNTIALEVTHVDHSFGSHRVLRDVSVELEFGAVTAITGPNGAGKSTLLEILAGVLTPLAGQVTAVRPAALVVQRTTTPDLLPLTAFDVVSMGTWASRALRTSSLRRLERRRALSGALPRVGLAHRADRSFPALSGGQRQRVLLAQAIVRNASILLLDEPTTGLDANSREQTRAILAEEAARGAAVAVVTHDTEAIEVAVVTVRLVEGVWVQLDQVHPARGCTSGAAPAARGSQAQRAECALAARSSDPACPRESGLPRKSRSGVPRGRRSAAWR